MNFNRLTLRVSVLFILMTGMMVFLPGCIVKKSLKQGAAYESAGMFRDAAELYYNALLKKPGNPDLKIALKRAGQLYADEQAGHIAQSFSNGDYKETVYSVLALREFFSRASRVGIGLTPDPNMNRYYDDAREQYLAKRYEAGQRLIGEQKFDEAGQVFAEISGIDPEYRDTRSYMKQAAFEPVYREGARLFGEGKYMEAYGRWNEIFMKDRNYNDVADKMKEALNERYKQGSILLMNEDFPGAATALGEVFRADPAFRDVKQLYTEARNEPVYRNGNAMLAAGKCRTAYYAFDQVVKDAGTYRDAASLRDKALACAQYPIAVTTAVRKGQGNTAQQFQPVLTGQLVNLKNLFLKVYDLSVISPGMVNSILNPAGNFDVPLLRQLESGKGVKALLFVEFTTVTRTEGQLTKSEKTGFERTSSKNETGTVVYNDRKVKYEEYSQRNQVSISLVYKLVSCTTGELLLSDRISENRSDEINYAVYNGTKDNLYPANYQNGEYTINLLNYRSLQNLLKASRSITTTDKLADAAFHEAARRIASSINNFNPEK